MASLVNSPCSRQGDLDCEIEEVSFLHVDLGATIDELGRQ